MDPLLPALWYVMALAGQVYGGLTLFHQPKCIIYLLSFFCHGDYACRRREVSQCVLTNSSNDVVRPRRR